MVHLKDLKAPQSNQRGVSYYPKRYLRSIYIFLAERETNGCEQDAANAIAVSTEIGKENQPTAGGSEQAESVQPTSTGSAAAEIAALADVTNKSDSVAPSTSVTAVSGDVTTQPSAEEPNVVSIKEIRPNDMEILVEYFGDALALQIIELSTLR